MTASGSIGAAVAILGAGVAVLTLVKAFAEYSRQGAQRRAEQFFEFRRRLREGEGFAELAELLDEAASPEPDLARTAQERVAKIPFRIKRNYVGLFEEVAMCMESGLIQPSVAHYMFGYYALLCRDCPAFWANVGRGNRYWQLFEQFCVEMEGERERPFDHRALSL